MLRLQNGILRLYYRSIPVFALIFLWLPVAGPDAHGGWFMLAAVLTCLLGFGLRRLPYAAIMTGAGLAMLGAALLVLTIVYGPDVPSSLVSSSDTPGRDMGGSRKVSSPFVDAVRAGGGAAFLAALAWSAAILQSGVFLSLSGEASPHIRRRTSIRQPVEALGLGTFVLLLVVPLALVVFIMMPLQAGLLGKTPPDSVNAALASVGWRLSVAIPVAMASLASALFAIYLWLALNVLRIREELRATQTAASDRVA